MPAVMRVLQELLPIYGCLLLILPLLSSTNALAEDSARPRKIVLIAGKKSHGPGAHDYERTMRLFKVMLDNSNIADRTSVEVHEQGWPKDEHTLDNADTIVFYSDGRDGDKYSDVPFVEAQRMQLLQKQMKRGCGMMTMHFSTFVNDEQGKSVLDWVGGYFDWEDEAGKRNWYSKISQIETLELASREHPISRGVPRMVQLRDEVYWKMRFLPNDKRRLPIWRAIDVFDDEAGDDASTVAWAIERKDGGRGFGTSIGHAYRLWQDDGVRKLFLNAIAWTAQAEIPENGVESRFYADEEVQRALSGVEGSAKAMVEAPMRVLLFTGNKAHSWHNGEASTARVKAALEADPAIGVQVSHEIEDLSTVKLSDFDAIVLNNYANWHDPKTLSDASKAAFLQFLEEGGGLVVIHFANGAFHFSLPEAGESDWPEYRQVVRRVWDHHGRGGPKSAHDAFGQFTVNPTDVNHPISSGLQPFEVNDELYYNQAGNEPIEPLITAKSKNTNRDEPLAWAYNYKQARVFQTLLGHSEKTYDTYEPREMLRRAVAWVSNRQVIPLPKENEKLPTPQPDAKEVPAEAPKLVPGKFGQALDAKSNGLVLETKAEQVVAPLTVECWAKLSNKQGFNILVASEPKSSKSHWELYSYAGSGVCSVYMPGRGGEFKTKVDICDDRWHHVGFTFTQDQLHIYVDGQLAGEGKLAPLAAKPADKAEPRVLGVGRLVEGGIGCAGLIDDVRLTRGSSLLEKIPEEALKKAASTLLLISFEDKKELQALQTSALKALGQQQPVAQAVKPDHWGIEGVGFKWREEDSRDDRWKETEIGPFLASSLPLGTAGGTVLKGLSVRIGDEGQATVCYDTASGKLRAAWSGGFLKFTPARFGLIMSPLIDGDPQFLATDSPNWDSKAIEYQGLELRGKRIFLKYLVDGIEVEESPWLQQRDDNLLFTRNIEIGPASREMTLRVAGTLEEGDTLELRKIHNHQIGLLKSGGKTIVFLSPNDTARWSITDGKDLRLTLPAHEDRASLHVVFGTCEEANLDSFVTHAEALSFELLSQLKEASSQPNWTKEITTQGLMAKDDSAYVVDSITIPFDNPYKALFFTSGHDAVSADTMAVCTVHGDVWLVSGVKERLAKLQWKRFATGLFQPLGLVAKPDGIYVLGRDQITRLHDTNNDGETDFYECFSNAYPTSSGGHDYTTCLETDESGNFYFITAQQGIWRMSADGKQLDNIAGGLRNPNGLGVGPGPIVTVAPQEGNWTPASYIGEAKPGDYFGFGGPRVTPDRPLGWTQPLCFIPRKRDNSSGGQVWVTSDRWGPLKNQMLHFSYGQCRPMLVLREVIADQVQGGTVDMSQLFDSGAMRGRFNPYDGQLYVSGLRGWTTAATQDGCLQRVRYTGLPANMPVQFRTLKNGVAITFTETLNRTAAEDLDNYHLEQWNYRYSESYGSPDFKASDSKQEGHDEVRVESATLLADGRTVFLEIADLRPVNQLSIGFALTSGAGEEFRHTIAYTIHNINDEMMDPTLLHRPSDTGRLTQTEEALLKPGLLAKFSQQNDHDMIPLRMAAFFIGKEEPVTQLLPPGEFTAELSGYLKVPLKSDVKLSTVGQGKVSIEINGKTVLSGEGLFEGLAPASVSLRGGYNTLKISYESSAAGDAQLRLFWEGKDFAREPVPPTAFAYRGDDAKLQSFSQLHNGSTRIRKHRCNACHEPQEDSAASKSEHTLEEMAARLQSTWMADFLLNPDKLSSHVEMPRFFDASQQKDRQAAADIAVWISSLSEKPLSAKTSDSHDEALVDRGTILYEKLNCYACHCFTPPDDGDEYDRISLFHVNVKYTTSGLLDLLQSGHRELSLRLASDEPEALAAYLQATAEGRLVKAKELIFAKSERGQKAFTEHLCSQCHKSGELQMEDVKPKSFAMNDLMSGCLAEDASQQGKAPAFSLNANERNEIVSYLQKYGGDLRPAPFYEQASQLFASLRCTACHNRDGKSGTRLAVFGEESETGLLPEQLPDLTWAGEKLQTHWLAQLFAGEHRQPARNWMTSRMPNYKMHAEQLSKSLAAEHGLPPKDEPLESPQAELVASGQLLTLKENLDCRQCHGIGALEPTGDEKTKLAPGINFALVKDRLRPEYYRRFVLDPPRIDPSTRMIKLAPDGRTTKVTSIYDGHAPQQFEAIWNYIQSLESLAPKK